MKSTSLFFSVIALTAFFTAVLSYSFQQNDLRALRQQIQKLEDKVAVFEQTSPLSFQESINTVETKSKPPIMTIEPGTPASSFVIKKDGEKIAEVNPAEGVYTAEIFGQIGENVYIGLTPDGIGGYILYGGVSKLYKVDLEDSSTREITINGFATDISPDGTKVVFIPAGSGTIKVISVEGEEASMTFDIPDTYGQAGDALFSPNGEKLAYAAAVGDPENEAGAVFTINLETGAQTLVEESKQGYFKIEKWVDNENLDYSRKL